MLQVPASAAAPPWARSPWLGGVSSQGCVGQTGQTSRWRKLSTPASASTRAAQDPATAPPDLTGTPTTQTLGRWDTDAYGDTSGTQHAELQATSTCRTPARQKATRQCVDSGGPRDLWRRPPPCAVPFIDCASMAGGQLAPIVGFACMLLLEPYDKRARM